MLTRFKDSIAYAWRKRPDIIAGCTVAFVALILVVIFWGQVSRFITVASYTPPLNGTQVSDARAINMTGQGEGLPVLLYQRYWPLEHIDPLDARPTRDDPPSEATAWGYCPPPRVVAACRLASASLEHPRLIFAHRYDPVERTYRDVEVIAVVVPLQDHMYRSMHCSLPPNGTVDDLKDLPTVYSLFGGNRDLADIITVNLPEGLWTCRVIED